MRSIVGAMAFVVGLIVSAAAEARDVTITQSNRSEETVAIFQMGGGCDDFTSQHSTTAFGNYEKTLGSPGSGGYAFQNTLLTSDGLFTGTMKSEYVGAPDCQLGSHGEASGCVQFTVTGTAVVRITAVLKATLVQLGSSEARIEIRKNPLGVCNGGSDVFTRSVFTGGVTDLAVEESISLSAGTYRLRVHCLSQDQSVGFFHSSKAQVDFTVSLGQLENDNCGDAIFVAVNTPWAFDTTDATTDGPADSLCLNAGQDQIFKDVWYRVIAPCTGFLSASTCNTANFDTRLAIYDGCPNGRNPRLGGSILSCDDDSTFCSFSFPTTETTILAEAGTEYLIRLGGFNGTSGTGTLLVTCGQLYDSCTNPLAIEEESLPFTTVGATSSGPDLPVPCIAAGNDDINQDIWFTHFSSPGGRLHISTCNDADFDTRLAVYNTSCPTAASPVLGCNDDVNSCGGLTSFVAMDVAPGTLLFIRLGGYLSGQGEGNLTVRRLTNPADLNDDGKVDGADLGLLLGLWDLAGLADINLDGVVNGADLGLLLGAWTG